jgi:hypothetical protein
MLLFLLLGFGSNSRDLVSYLNPDDYFASRKVEVRVETLLSLAGKTPATGKDQVMQLLAIRKLVANPAEARKDARVRDLLTQIAERKKGQDRLGFAEDYARRALAVLDGKPAPAATIPKASLRTDAYAWFPKDAALVAGFDLRPVAGVPAADVSTLQELVTKFMRQGNQDKVFDTVEKLGNIRLDRFSVGIAPAPQAGGNGRPNGRIYVRVTGKADHRRLVTFLCDETKLAITQQDRVPGRDLVTFLGSADNKDRPPAIAVVGDSEILVAGYMNDQGDHVGVLREMLEVRAGRQPSVTAGALASRLKKVNPQTFILLAGDISKELGLGPLGAPGLDGKGMMPKTVVMEATRKTTGLDIAVEAGMENEADAQRLADEASKSIRDAVEDVRRELKAKREVPEEVVELLVKTLESVKTTAKGPRLTITVHISNDLMKAVPDLLGKLGAIPGGPQPEFKKEEIKELKKQPERRRGDAPQPPPGATVRRAAIPALAPWVTNAVVAGPRPPETSTRRAALLSA